MWVNFYGFGDALEFAANAYNFKKLFPDTLTAFLTDPLYAELIQNQPYIDEVLTGYKYPFAAWRETLRKVRAGRYKWLIAYHGGGHTAWLARCIWPRLAASRHWVFSTVRPLTR